MTTSHTDTRRSKYETVLFETKGHICHITLNRPNVLNAMNNQLAEELRDALFEFDSDPELWVGILAGAGRAFCSGIDVRQVHLRPREDHESPQARGVGLEGLLQTVNWKPMIAAVHGYAVGGGYALMLGCDLAVAAEGTQFQITEVSRGVAGSQFAIATWFCGGGRFANEIALTGRKFTAEESLQHGIINRLVPESELMATAEGLAEQIISNPPLSVRCNVRVMRHFLSEKMRDASYYREGLRLFFTEDFRESTNAFVERRTGIYHGR